MAGNQGDIYKWKRITSRNKPLAAVTKKSSKPTDDIQDWIKKVEEASTQAAAATFGLPSRGQRSNGYSRVEATLDAVRDHDEAYNEAQDLLNQWMAEKCNLDDHVTMDDEYDMEGAAERSPEVKSALRSEWDDMLERHDPMLVSKTKYTTSDELYADIEGRDDYSTVQSILDSMMDKDLIEPKQKKKLRIVDEEKKKVDPRTTMAARQQKVKENRMKKEQERKQLLEAKQAKKAAQLQARQMVQQEEKEKAIKIQREEQMIREEMAKIRKEMQDQKRLEEETKARERAILAEARKEEEERRKKEELVMKRIENARRQQEDEERKVIEERMVRDAQEAYRLKTLQSHFHAWYRLVQDQRLQMGKARALSEWRSLLKSWNAWRAFVRACRAEREAKQTEMDIKLSHRRRIAAESHYRHHLLRKTFAAWQVYCHNESIEKELHDKQTERRSKMAAFLDAAASGKLWTNRSEEEEGQETRRSDRPISAGRNIGANFGGEGNPDPISSRSDPSSRISTTHSRQDKGIRHQSSKKPKHAWQVTRKHVNLTAEEIASIGDNMDSSMADIPTPGQPPSDGKPKQGERPIQYTVNNFEHRYAAQQKLLAEQQEQLREQRRLIEELQLGQKQQGMKKQLEQIRDGEYVQDIQHPDGHPLDNMFNQGGQRSERSELSAGDSTSRTDWSEETTSTNKTRSTARSQPPLLKGMEERAARRAKMKAEREERHKQKEQQKLKEMQEEEARKVAAEEAEKKAAIEKRKEEKRLAKLREQERLDRIEKAQRQTAQADVHYQNSLLRHYGFRPWCKLVNRARQNMQVAVDHHSNNLLHTVLLSWHHMTQEVIQRKNDLADVRFKEILLRRSFNSWKRFGHYQSIQLQKARRHYLHRLKCKALLRWRDWVTDERIRMWQAEEQAEEHNTRRIMKTAFLAWRRYPRMLKEERAKEIRRQEMRRKVASIIPDFGLT